MKYFQEIKILIYHEELRNKLVLLLYTRPTVFSLMSISCNIRIKSLQVHLIMKENLQKFKISLCLDIQTILIQDEKILNISAVFFLLPFSQKVHLVQLRLVKSSLGYREKCWGMLVAKPNSISFVIYCPCCLFWRSNLK